MADAEGEAEDVAAVAFPEGVAVVVAAAAFRGAVAAVFRDPVEEISPEEALLGRAPLIEGLARGIFLAAAEVVVWLIPATPHRAPELHPASD